MRGLWKLYLFVGVSFLIAQSQEDGLEAPEETGGEAEEGEPPNQMQDEIPEDEDEQGKSVWQDEAISSDQIREIHGKIDSNKDGKISMDDVLLFAHATTNAIHQNEAGITFDNTDVNKDGKISLEELLEYTFGSTPLDEDGNPEDLPAHPSEDPAALESIQRDKELEGEKFKAADLNKDGFLDKDELPAILYPDHHDGVLTITAGAALKDLDTDGDGELSPEEFWKNSQPDDDDDDISEDAKAVQKSDFEMLDVDKNGKLNFEEYRKWESGKFHVSDAMNQLFEVADANDDKHLTAEELDNAREALGNSMAIEHFTEWVQHHEL